MGNTFGPKGLCSGSSLHVSSSKISEIVVHEADEPDSVARPALMPTVWPAKTWLRLIFFRLKQMRPQVVTVTVLSWKG